MPPPQIGAQSTRHAVRALGAANKELDGLRARGVEVFFEEDRRGGVIDGPRAYFRDPDGTPLEFINRTTYAGQRS